MGQLLAAIPVRDVRGMKYASAAFTGNRPCLFAGTFGDGSDGTRTRDLRRDRPVMAFLA
jgi:hypothetical protein